MRTRTAVEVERELARLSKRVVPDGDAEVQYRRGAIAALQFALTLGEAPSEDRFGLPADPPRAKKTKGAK